MYYTIEHIRTQAENFTVTNDIEGGRKYFSYWSDCQFAMC